MFLATKELKYSKTKFALIIFVIVLISYLVYFLTSLAYGLASSYTNAIEKWDADEIILTVDANDTMMMSFLDEQDYNNINVDGEKAKLGVFPGVINNPLAENVLDSRIDVFFFGIEDSSFLMPSNFADSSLSNNKVIVDEAFNKEGYEVGSLFGVSGSDQQYEIIGFSKKSTYQTAPVVFMDLTTFQEHRYGENNTPDLFNATIIKGESKNLDESFLSYTIKDFIGTLPGYNAQVLTFSVMIVFLIIIIAFVLGIFIYVLTIQKTSMFGVMKAQGISNAYIGGSVLIQTFILVLIGIVIGFILTFLTGTFLGEVIPFATNYLFYGIITLAFFFFAFLGAMFSVRTVLKIDPLIAIGA